VAWTTSIPTQTEITELVHTLLLDENVVRLQKQKKKHTKKKKKKKTRKTENNKIRRIPKGER
jgi:ribosomal protein S6